MQEEEALNQGQNSIWVLMDTRQGEPIVLQDSNSHTKQEEGRETPRLLAAWECQTAQLGRLPAFCALWPDDQEGARTLYFRRIVDRAS
ncbi:hypothetical protein HPP92_029174 [Vanilla planifolia]|uniref:Uncharacterized protein n=1 Tax=Vanilla planifolia TaxID=51239 RepID=A0A835P593_VANPL|nr:hypothetical protein HPP92_029174 [Vanilla planifolia]KAG0445771.1 hypothetical protein HPP92_029161 [Vanilla planifolia]